MSRFTENVSIVTLAAVAVIATAALIIMPIAGLDVPAQVDWALGAVVGYLINSGKS